MIRLEGVHKRFDGGHAALAGVDLDVARGEVFGVIGRSGAGKSTLVRLLNGLERPSQGRVSVDGVDVATLSGEPLRALRRRVGMIFQNFGLLASRTAAENVALPLRIAGAAPAAIAARVPALLDRVGLADHGHKYPAQLSGGQKQRVGVARALATGPDILLCDEATSALDPETTRSILSLIGDLNRELGITVVLITHEMDVVRQVCDSVTVLEAGRVAEHGPVSEIFLNPQAPETRRLLAETDEATDVSHAGFAGRVVRLTLADDSLFEPVLTRVARETGADIAILDGRTGSFKDRRFAQFVLGVSGKDQDGAVAALTRYGRVST